jgi:hypothetical protein
MVAGDQVGQHAGQILTADATDALENSQSVERTGCRVGLLR